MGESEAGEHWVMMSIFYGMLFALNCRRVTAIVLLQNSRNAALFDFHFLQGILCFLCVFLPLAGDMKWMKRDATVAGKRFT